MDHIEEIKVDDKTHEASGNHVSTFFQEIEKKKLADVEREKNRKMQHAKEVEDIFNALKKQFNDKSLKTVGILSTYFWSKLNSLCDKWLGAHTLIWDSEGVMFITNILLSEMKNHPLVVAIIGDSSYFQQNYAQYEGERTIDYWFAFACTCGAEKIVDFLFQNYRIDCIRCLKDHSEIIAYAMTSGNMKLTERIVCWAKDAGRQDAGVIHYYNEGECPAYFFKKIESIFNEANISFISEIPEDDAEIKRNFGIMYLERNFKPLLEKIKIDPTNAQCAYALALHYRNGWGINIDDFAAVEYFKIAANKLHAGACLELAVIYGDGCNKLNIEPDINKAKYYIEQGLKGCGIKDFDEQYFYNQETKIKELQDLYKVLSNVYTEEFKSAVFCPSMPPSNT